MIDLNLLAKMLSRGAQTNEPGRRFNCPNDRTIAAYVDSALGDSERSRVQEHLAGCAYCRSLVSDIVKEGRITDVPEAPAALLEKARALVPSKPKRWGWTWGPVAAAGVLASTAILVTTLETPRSTTLPEWPAPAVPVLSESKPVIPPTRSRPETVRKPNSPDNSLTILSPRPDSILPREQIEIRWSVLRDSLSYHIRVLTADGDLVWETDSTVNHIKLPKQPTLKSGKYYALVSAMLKNGRTAKSSPVKFQVADSE
jgi:hypothetical protein